MWLVEALRPRNPMIVGARPHRWTVLRRYPSEVEAKANASLLRLAAKTHRTRWRYRVRVVG